MNILASKLIPLDNLYAYKAHFAVYNQQDKPLDVFVRDKEEWKDWNSWRGHRDDFSRQYIFSLIQYYHQPNKWLFGGIFEVVARNKDGYEVKLINEHEEYIGRLLFHYPKPPARGRAFYLEQHFNKLEVSHIFEKPFEGEAFCGYENIEHSFTQFEAIFKQHKQDWKAALVNVKGVYLIVDKSNGKMYVGSAYGDAGIWSRWACYIETGHGYNDELSMIIKENGIAYARNNFQLSILEFRSMRTDDQVVIDREQYWKRVLQTNKFGYNKN